MKLREILAKFEEVMDAKTETSIEKRGNEIYFKKDGNVFLVPKTEWSSYALNISAQEGFMEISNYFYRKMNERQIYSVDLRRMR